ncbi:MAG: tyrosine-type recombinase/integrase [Clostridia bacterium]
MLTKYKIHLIENEKSPATIEKYIRDVKNLLNFLQKEGVSKIKLLEYKENLIKTYAPASVNSMLASVNSYLDFLELEQLKIKPIKIQKQLFVEKNKEINLNDYQKLIKTAENKGDFRLSLIIQTICSTGIRVSELLYITFSSVHSTQTVVRNKGKTRTILLPKDLCKLLKKYCFENNIKSGSIFITKNGKPINRSNIWKMMKSLCKTAKINENKVFPHNLRHLFAKTFYKIEKDISKLADILGHSSIETTRIYIISSFDKHVKQINKMNLVFTT